MIKKLDTREIVTILVSGNFDELLGAVEDDHFECKGEPYRIEDDHQKFELAKDVSALANAKGGIILIGAQTERDPTQATDIVTKIRPFSDSVINISQYESVVRTWVYPPIKDLEIKWFALSQKSGLGLVAIIVGDQDQLWRPFLLTRSIEPSGRVSTTLFGYAERGTGKSLPMSVQQIHTILRDGYRVGTGALIPISQPDKKPPQEGPANTLPEKLEAAVEAVQLVDRPIFILAAVPNQMIELESLFSTRNAEIVKLLEDPPQLRSSGFGPDAGINSRIIEGKCRRTVIPHYKLLEVWRDGTVIMIGAGDADFLAWGNKSHDRLKINQLVLIETSYLFALLTKEVLHKATLTPQSVLYRLGLHRMTLQGNCLLFPGPLNPFSHGGKTASGSDASFTTTALLDDDPAYPAFRLVAEVYHWFGFEDDKIPYTSVNEKGQRFIDPGRIIEMTKQMR